MVSLGTSHMLRAVLLAGAFLVLAIPSRADEPPDTPFSKEVKSLTGDWVVQDWRQNILKAHPDRYTWQSDRHVSLYPEEPAAGRSAEQVARAHFDSFSLDDDSVDPTMVSMDGAEEMAPGILVKPYTWSFAFDENVSLFGVVTTMAGTYVPFRSNCQQDGENFSTEYDYRFEECLRKSLTILTAIKGIDGARLPMPPAPAPLTIPDWESQYLPTGVSVSLSASSNGLRRATVMVAPPRAITEARLRAEIESFSKGLIEDNDRADNDPGSAQWVGSASEVWIRRIFPEAFDGPSTIMAGAVRTPGGKVSLIGVRCPNDGWKVTCAHGVDLARQQAASGVIEQRRTAIVAASQKSLPANGLKASQVAGIYTTSRNTIGFGGLMTGFVVDGPLLLKDGSACSCFNGPLGGIVPSKSKAENPGDWGTWRKSGSTIVITWAESTEEIEITGDNLMIGGDASTRIEGEFRLVSGGGVLGSNTGWLNQSFFSFGKDGTFSNESVTGFTVSVGNPVDPDATVSGGSAGGGALGRYEVDGYNLKLTYPDGRIEYRGFAQYAHEAKALRKDSVMIDGSVYFRDDGD